MSIPMEQQVERLSHFERLTEFVTQQMQEQQVPGVAFGILERDDTIEMKGLGVTNIDHPLDVTPDTRFQIGSITKTVTALLAMLFVEKGDLDLDAPIRHYWPEFLLRDEATAQQLTMRDLLTHVGGFEGDFFIDTGEGDDALMVYAQRVSETAQALPLRTAYSYNNAGFVLAGYVLQLIGDKPYEQLVQEMIFEPLGMNNSTFGALDVMVKRFAVGHHIREEGPKVVTPWHLSRGINAAGGIVSTVGDLLRYAQFQMGDGTTEEGTRLLSVENMREMQAEQVSIWGSAGWTLGWAFDDGQGVLRLSHGGGTNGQISHLMFAPERQLAFCILTNAGTYLTSTILEWVQHEYMGLQLSDPVPLVEQPDYAEYTGVYARNMVTYEFQQTADGLQMQDTPMLGFPADTDPRPTPPPSTVAFHEPDGIVILGDAPYAGQTAHFLRDESGAVYGFRFGGRVNVKAKV